MNFGIQQGLHECIIRKTEHVCEQTFKYNKINVYAFKTLK